MIEKLLTHNRVQNIFLFLFLLIMALTYGINSYLIYKSDETKFYEEIDETLKNAANYTDLILDESFHDRAVDKDSISKEEDKKNIALLSKFTKYSKVEYVYTMVQRGEDIYFTSSSATDDDFEEDEVSYYFDKYESATAILKNVLKNKNIVYEESTDKWGTFRSVFIPMKSKNGNEYILGADVQVDFINKHLDTFVAKSTKIFLVIFTLLTLALIIYIYISKKALKNRLLS